VRKFLLISTIILLRLSAAGQIVVVPIVKSAETKSSPSARSESIEPLLLPFWDDFSTIIDGNPDSKLYQFGKSVWVNESMGINPPSLNVATFDGLDSLGRPYNVNDVLAKGVADKLVSAPIRMDLVTGTDRTRVFLSFFYQFHGHGEPPDMGDYLQLKLKNNTGGWEVVWKIENDGTLASDQFRQLIIPITADRFFHESFQFRFENFARLSGPYDTWHVDYIYISNGKLQSSPVRPLFPDRTITEKITSLFDDYWSMPVKHFFTNPAGNMSKPVVGITNLRQDQVSGNGQPVSYSSSVAIHSVKKNQPTVVIENDLDINRNIGSELIYNQFRMVELNTLPDLAALDHDRDSIHIKLNVVFDTGDNKIKTPSEGDYDFAVFNPIEFRKNDSTSRSYILSNFYAYDDGTAEYGAGLNQPGAQLAYRFDMKTDQPDTIVAVDIYFPRFGDDSNQVIQFQILRELSNNPADIIYQQSFPIQRNTGNKFWRIPLIDQPAWVLGKFFIGWKQNSSAIIAVGLDKNSDSGSKIFANLNGTWQQNQTLKGNLMIRPVFGKGNGAGEVTSSREVQNFNAFPNPSTGVFYLPQHNVMQISVLDQAGRAIETMIEPEADRTRIALTNPIPGIYFLKLLHQDQWIVQKILIR
jgi:hypothetical protein